jgi:RNA polymerase sigma factor (sigma-70 family)
MHDTPTDVTLHELLDQREWLARLATALVRDPGSAEDAVQQTWLQALTAKSPLRDPRAWLAAVLGNVVRQGRRGEQRRARREHAAGSRRPEADVAAAEANERFETQRAVAAAVQALDEPFRATVLLHHFEGMSLAAIARCQRVPAGTVRWRLHRAHARLREQLSQRLGQDDWRGALVALCAPLRRSALLSPIVSVLLAAGVLAGVALLARARTTHDAGPAAVVSATATPAPAPDRGGAAAIPTDRVDRTAAAVPAAAAALAGGLRVTVRARIAGSGGDPLAGASLRLVEAKLGGRQVQGPLLAPFAAPTVANGAGDVVLELRAPGALLAMLGERPRGELVGTLVFAAGADGYAERRIEAHVGNGDDRWLGTLTLDAAAAIRGRVVGADGEPLSGVRVALLRPPFPCDLDARSRAQLAADSQHTVTTDDATGAFELAGAPGGLAMLWASKPGFASAWRVLDATGTRVPCDDLVLRAAPTAGTPTQAQTGVPMPAIEVFVVDSRGEPVEHAAVDNRITFADGGESGGGAHTAADGRARLPEFGERLVARVDLAVTGGNRALGAVALPDVKLVDGPIRVVLPPAAAAIEVHAQGADGEPLPRFTVMWDAPAPALGSGFVDGATGKATLAPPHVATQLVVRASGHAPATVPFVPGQTPSPIGVTLAPAGHVFGVVTANGDPVAGATVALLQCDEPVLQNGFLSEGKRVGNPEGPTDASGSFRIDHDRPGPVRLRVTSNGHATWLSERFAHDPAAPSRRFDVELRAGGAIEGTVRRRDGTPVPRALVAVNGFDGEPRTVFADGCGLFRVERLRAGGYEVRDAGQPLHRSWSTEGPVPGDRTPPHADCEVRDGATTKHDLVVDRCRVTGALRATGFDPRHWRVRLQRAHDGQPIGDEVTLRADGAFELASSCDGPHELRFTAPGGPLGNVSVVVRVDLVAGDNVVDVPLALAPLRGRAVGAANDGVWTQLWQHDAQRRVLTSVHVDPATLEFTAPLAPVGENVLVEGTAAGSTRELGRFVVAPR